MDQNQSLDSINLPNLIANAQLNEILDLINTNKININFKDLQNNSLLHYAIKYQNVSLLICLLQQYRLDVNIENKSLQTPLHIACIEGLFEIVVILLKHKANVNKQDIYGETPIFYAIKSNSVEIVQTLIKYGGWINVKDNYNITPLHKAVEYKNPQIVSELINAGAFINEPNSTWDTPLHVAVKNNDYKITKLLLDHGANPNTQNIMGETPLIIAVKNKYQNIEALIRSNLSSNLSSTHINNSQSNYLSQNNINLNKQTINAPQCYSSSSTKQISSNLSHNINQLENELWDFLQKQDISKIIEILDKYPYLSNSTRKINNILETPLHYAIRLNNIQLIKVILKHNPNINSINSLGQTPLHIAVENNNYKIVKLLLWLNASANIKDKNGNTPHNIATKNCYYEIANLIKSFTNKI